MVFPTPPPVVTPPRSSLPSTERKRHSARQHVKRSHPEPSELSRNTCLCGMPVARFKGHRSKLYCSDRCRQRTYRKRHMQAKTRERLAPVTSLPSSSRAPERSWHKRAARSRLERVNCFLQRSGGVKGETCHISGTRLVQSAGGRRKEYCSGRCRQRAYRERQVPVS